MKSVYRLRTAVNRSDLMVDIKARKIEKDIYKLKKTYSGKMNCVKE